jgi:hypothetical protein
MQLCPPDPGGASLVTVTDVEKKFSFRVQREIAQAANGGILSHKITTELTKDHTVRGLRKGADSCVLISTKLLPSQTQNQENRWVNFCNAKAQYRMAFKRAA